MRQLSAPLTVAWSCFAPGCAGWMLTLQGLMDIEMQLGCGAEGCCRAPWWAWADLARSPTSSPASGHHRGAPRLGHGAPGIASPLLPPTLLTGSFFFYSPKIHTNCFSVTKLPAIPLSVNSVARHLGIPPPASSLLSCRLQLPALPRELFSSHFLL